MSALIGKNLPSPACGRGVGGEGFCEGLGLHSALSRPFGPPSPTSGRGDGTGFGKDAGSVANCEVPSYTRQDVEFLSRGTRCRAWLFAPRRATSPAAPCIVMAHGLGGTRGSGLEPFAERFAAAGYAVLLFDYRHFGDSDGAPRQLLTVSRQLDDWRAAVACARALEGVDPARVALWGTSLSSGHVLTVAAADANIAAVVAQNPMTDGLAAVLQLVRHAGLGQLLRLAALALADQLRALLGLSPVFVPVVGRSGELAPLSGDKAYAGYLALASSTWRNRMTARMALTLALYRPALKARQLSCPTLIQACMQDQAVSAPAAVAYARRAGAQLQQYAQMDHFDIYVGQDFERAVGDQLEFFGRVWPDVRPALQRQMLA